MYRNHTTSYKKKSSFSIQSFPFQKDLSIYDGGGIKLLKRVAIGTGAVVTTGSLTRCQAVTMVVLSVMFGC